MVKNVGVDYIVCRIIQHPVSPEPGVYPELSPGQLIMLSTFAMGRDSQLFPPDASRFWPGRWERNQQGSLAGVSTPFAWLPFGHGARACIGREMATKQIVYLLRHAFLKFKFILFIIISYNSIITNFQEDHCRVYSDESERETGGVEDEDGGNSRRRDQDWLEREEKGIFELETNGGIGHSSSSNCGSMK